MRPRRLLASCVLVATLAGACAGDDPIAPRAARELDATYEELVAAVEAGDRAAARRALRDLTAEVDAAEASGDIAAERADAITDAAARVLADLTSLPRPEPVSPSPSPSPTPSPTPEGDGEDEDD